MLAGLSKYSRGQVRQRGSSPKLQVLNTALMSAQDHRSITEARQDGDYWDGWSNPASALTWSIPVLERTSASPIGASETMKWTLFLQQGKTTVAIEVKSGARRQSFPGMDAFVRLCKPKRQLLVADRALPLEEFLSKTAAHWLQ